MDKEEYKKALRKISKLMDKENLTKKQEAKLDFLAWKVERYEKAKYGLRHIDYARIAHAYTMLPYHWVIIPCEDGGYVAHVEELPGCATQGDNEYDIVDMLKDAMQGWIEIALEDGYPIPLPRKD